MKPKWEGDIAQLEHEQELDDLREMFMTDYLSFAIDCLNNGPKDGNKFADDPGVLDYVGEFGEYLVEHLGHRDTLQTFDKCMVIVTRECNKSTLITQTAGLFHNVHDPNVAVAISSATQEGIPSSTDFMTAIHQHMNRDVDESPLNMLFGPFVDPRRSNRQDRIVTALRQNTIRRDPTFRAFSVQTGGTSGHFDAVYLDDPTTKEIMEKYGEIWVKRMWDHYVSLGYVVKQDGLFVLVATRYGDRDLPGLIIEQEIEPVVRERTLLGAPPGHLPDDFQEFWYKYAHLAGWKVIFRMAEYNHETGEPQITFPLVWPRPRIDAEKRKSVADAAAQLNNRPSDREDAPIKPVHVDGWWISADEVPAVALHNQFILADWAFKSGKAAIIGAGDWNVMFLGCQHAGIVYLIRGWHSRTADQKEAGKQYQIMLQEAAKMGGQVKLMTCDKPTGGADPTAFENFWVDLAHEIGEPAPAILMRNRPGGPEKLARIKQNNGYLQNGKLRVVRNIAGAYELADEYLRQLGNPKFRDHMDAVNEVWGRDVYQVIGKKAGGIGAAKRPHVQPQPVVHGSFDSDGRFVVDRSKYGRKGSSSPKPAFWRIGNGKT